MGLTSAAPESGLISNIAPGLRIDGSGARFNAFLDYRRDYLFYQGNSQWDRHQNQLTSYGRLEAVDNWMYVDASASIVQRSVSAFGPVSVDTRNALTNQTETRTTQIAPFISGRIGASTDYLVRLNLVDSRSDDPTLADTRVDQFVGSLKSNATAGVIGWFGEVLGTDVKNDVIGARYDTRLRGGLIVPLGAHIHVSGSVGTENSNFASNERETNSTPGLGLQWAPNRHTQVAALREKRFFGYGHNLLMAYRTAWTAWRYTDTKDVTVLPIQLGGYSQSTVQTLMSDLLEASIPDSFERNRAVRSRMDLLGAAADLPNVGGVQTSRSYVERNRIGSVAWLGARNMLTLSQHQRDQELLPFSPIAVDSFLGSTAIRERGTSLAWLYRLSPLKTLNVAVTRMRTEGLDVGAQSSTQNVQAVTLNIRLGPRAVASLGLRRARFVNSVAGRIEENALAGSLTQRF
jgi:uncharacterized protein (PEP-CTERM system associated)